MEEKDYEMAFQIIAKAGDSKAFSMDAIRAARDGDFEQADNMLKQSEESMRQAHDFQFDMIQQEAAGNHMDVNIILVHAQDHLSMAVMAKDMAEEMVLLYKELRGRAAGEKEENT